MTTLRDTFTFEFPVESILDGLDRRIAAERHALDLVRTQNRHILDGTIKGKNADRQRTDLRDELATKQHLVTALRRWRSLFAMRTPTALYRLTVADCAYFDLPYETRQVGPRF